MKEIKYRNDFGSVSTPCPHGENVKLYNSLHSTVPSSERVRVVGSSDCTACQFYGGIGEYYKKFGTSYIESIMCKHD